MGCSPTSPQATPAGRRASREDLWLHLMVFGCGTIPWLGYALLGAWDQRELGVGLLLMGLTAKQVARALWARAHDADHAPPKAQGGRDGRRVSDIDTRVFRGQLGLHRALRAHLTASYPMTILTWLGGALAAALLAYLFGALLFPEQLS